MSNSASLSPFLSLSFEICMAAIAPTRSLNGQSSSKRSLNYVGGIPAYFWHANQLLDSVSMKMYWDKKILFLCGLMHFPSESVHIYM